MTSRALCSLTAVSLAFTLAPAALAGAKTYPIRHLQPNDAIMALQVRVPQLHQDCHVTPSHASDPRSVGLRGVLTVTCNEDAIQEQIAQALAAIDVTPPTQRFHIAVLTASRKEGPVPDLPASEAKALADFKKVMTYRSFEIEAETVLQCDRDAQTQLNTDYALELVIQPDTVTGQSIDVRKFQLRAVNPQVAPTGQQTYPTYLETSFSIKKGETIVLGTSVTDQQARVVLVTALP